MSKLPRRHLQLASGIRAGLELRTCEHLAGNPVNSVAFVDLRPTKPRASRPEKLRVAVCDACYRRTEALVLVELGAGRRPNA